MEMAKKKSGFIVSSKCESGVGGGSRSERLRMDELQGLESRMARFLLLVRFGTGFGGQGGFVDQREGEEGVCTELDPGKRVKINSTHAAVPASSSGPERAVR
jgi:hypothetical protein